MQTAQLSMELLPLMVTWYTSHLVLHYNHYAYVANLILWVRAPVAIGFSTSDLGTVVDDVSAFEGKTYAVDLSSGIRTNCWCRGSYRWVVGNNILIGVTGATDFYVIGWCSFLQGADQDNMSRNIRHS